MKIVSVIGFLSFVFLSFQGFAQDDPDLIDPVLIKLQGRIISAGDSSAVPYACLLYTSPSPRDRTRSRMPSSA